MSVLQFMRVTKESDMAERLTERTYNLSSTQTKLENTSHILKQENCP